MDLKWPEAFKEVPLLQKVEKNTCTFEDGSSADVDAIILCTGYLHHFPFMASELKLRATNRLAIANLYKGIVWVAMQDQLYTFNMFDAHAWYIRDVIMDCIDVPNRDGRLADVEDRISRESAGKDLSHLIRYKGEYIKEMIADTDYPSFDVDDTIEAFFQWKYTDEEDIMTFRDHC